MTMILSLWIISFSRFPYHDWKLPASYFPTNFVAQFWLVNVSLAACGRKNPSSNSIIPCRLDLFTRSEEEAHFCSTLSTNLCAAAASIAPLSAYHPLPPNFFACINRSICQILTVIVANSAYILSHMYLSLHKSNVVGNYRNFLANIFLGINRIILRFVEICFTDE